MSYYKMNPARAREYESEDAGNVTPKITEKGAYTGTIINAREFQAKSGNIGIIIDYKDDSGAMVRTNRFMTYTSDRKTPMWGMNVIDSLMTCLRLREMNGVPGTYEHWDFDAKKMVESPATIFPDLMNKPIGVILQPEEFDYQGEIKTKMAIRGFFDPHTRQTATEILDKKVSAERVDKWVAGMADVKRVKQDNKPQQQNSYQQAKDGSDFTDDVIPF